MVMNQKEEKKPMAPVRRKKVKEKISMLPKYSSSETPPVVDGGMGGGRPGEVPGAGVRDRMGDWVFEGRMVTGVRNRVVGKEEGFGLGQQRRSGKVE